MTKFVCSQCRGTHVLDERFINTNLFVGYYCLDCKMWVTIISKTTG